MSVDFKLKHKCPHHVVEEWLALSNDLKTLHTVKSPSSGQAELLWNRHKVPKDGLHSTVRFSGRNSGPFDIEAGVSDEFKISVDSGPTQSVQLPIGRRVRTQEVVAAINDQTYGIRARAVKGRIEIESLEEGPQASIMLKGGNAHSVLGFREQRFYRGRTIVPGWSIVKNERDRDPRARKIVFDEALKAQDDILEVSYYTRREDCRRCAGLGIEYDLRHNRKGVPITISGADLLLQEVEKIVFTIRGSNIFHRWYGTTIADLIGAKAVGGGQIVETQLVSEISETLRRYKQVKDQQARYQPVSDAEMLNRVVNISVEQDSADPTVFYTNIAIQNRSGGIEQVKDTLVVTDASFAEGFQRIQ